MDEKNRPASYRVISDAGGERYRFYCELSGALCCTTGQVSADTQAEALRLAWEEGKRCLNLCRRCGKWVCDAMYNADVLECVGCTPWEELPRFCSRCGAKATGTAVHCAKCGARLRYREVWK